MELGNDKVNIVNAHCGFFICTSSSNSFIPSMNINKAPVELH